MPGAITRLSQPNVYDLGIAKAKQPMADGMFNGLHAAVHSDSRLAQIAAEKKAASKSRKNWNRFHAFVGAGMSGESASLYINKKDDEWSGSTKLFGFCHRYFGVNTSYAGRILVTFGNRVVQCVYKAPKLGAIRQTLPIQMIQVLAQPCTGLYGTTMALGGIRGVYKMAYNTYADVKTNADRKEYVRMAKEYDLVNGNLESALKMRELLDKDRKFYTSDAGLVYRNGKQLAYDKVAQSSELYIKGAVVTMAFMSLSQSANVLNTALPGVQLVVQVTLAGLYGWRYAVQTAAMNNAFLAEKKLKDREKDAVNPICLQTTRNIIDERVPLARSFLGRTVGYTFAAAGTVASYAVGATGVGMPATAVMVGIGAGAMALTHGAGAMYEFIHYRKSEKLRDKAREVFKDDWANAPKRQPGQSRADYEKARYEYFASKCQGHENLGWNEFAMIKMLRGDNLAERTSVVNYLKDLGISQETLVAIQLTGNEGAATRLLCTHMYSNRLRHQWNANRHLHKSLGEACWISAGIRNVKKINQMRIDYVEKRKNVKLELQNSVLNSKITH